MMNDPDIYSSGAQGLAALVHDVMANDVDLTDDELAGILEEELSTPIRDKVRFVSETQNESMTKISWNDDTIGTIHELLSSDRPPLGLLNVVKEYAKQTRNNLAVTPSPKVCSVIYFATIAAAQARCGQSITALDPKVVRQGVRWAADQPWVGEPIRSLVDDRDGNR